MLGVAVSDALGDINRQKEYESRLYGPDAYRREIEEEERRRKCVVCGMNGCTDCGELAADRGQWLWAKYD